MHYIWWYMSTKIVNSRNPRWKDNNFDWNEQDLAIRGKRDWSQYCINLHYLESPNQVTSNGICKTRHYARLFYAANPVPVRPAIQNVQTSAQASAGDFKIKAPKSDYIQDILDNNVDGEGLSSYNWLTAKPLEKLCGNGLVWLGVSLPALPDGMETVSAADYMQGRVGAPRWFKLNAIDVYDWVEKEGDIEDGQFSMVLYRATYPMPNKDTGFIDHEEAIILYTETEIITYSKSGRKILNQEANTLGFVPIVSADITESLVGEGVQYSKQAVEIDSLALSNMRDGYFSIPVARGFKVEGSLSADDLVETNDAAQTIEFATPGTAPEAETRAKIESQQRQFENSVQQAHSNFSREGATIGSGAAYKELGSKQAQSVEYIMDMLLEKFKVTVLYAMKATGQDGEIEMAMPSSYEFTSEDSKLDQAETLDSLTQTAISKDSKKAINAKKLEKLFQDSEFRQKLIEADNDAIDSGADSIPTFEG